MEQELRFGLDMGGLALLKKRLGQLAATFETGFFMFFMGKKIYKQKHWSVRLF